MLTILLRVLIADDSQLLEDVRNIPRIRTGLTLNVQRETEKQRKDSAKALFLSHLLFAGCM